MKTGVITGLALAIAIGAAAPASANSLPGLEAGAMDVASSAGSLQPGMIVLDRQGAKVGVISRVDQASRGRPAVLIDVNGTKFRILASSLRLSRSGEQAITSLTQSEIRTSEILNGD